MTKTAPMTPMQPTTDVYALAARTALCLSGLVATVTMAAALYMHISSKIEARPLALLPPQESAELRWSTALFEPEGEPVRVTNPFDETEVFEFPAGTSEADARAAMADALLDRARERYARLDARAHQRR